MTPASPLVKPSKLNRPVIMKIVRSRMDIKLLERNLVPNSGWVAQKSVTPKSYSHQENLHIEQLVKQKVIQGVEVKTVNNIFEKFTFQSTLDLPNTILCIFHKYKNTYHLLTY